MVSAASAMLLQAKPDYAPDQVRAALLAAANWHGPAACDAGVYESSDAANSCSHARQPADKATSNGQAGMKILNNVGHGVLNVSRSLSYALSDPPNVVRDNLTLSQDSATYIFVKPDSGQSKVLLTWNAVIPGNNISAQIGAQGLPSMSNLGFVVKDSSGTKVAESDSKYQNVEFAVFSAPAGNYSVTVSGSLAPKLDMQHFALASSHGLVKNSPPAGLLQSIVTSFNELVSILLSAVDPDGNSLSYTIGAQPQMGTLSAPDSSGSVTYTPNKGATGIDNFTFVASDGFGSSEPVTVTINITGPAAQDPVDVFADDFESGSLSSWSNTGDDDWTVTSYPDASRPGAPPANKVATAGDCESGCHMEASFDLSKYGSANVTFWRYLDTYMDPGEYLKVSAYDGSSWSELATFEGSYSYGNRGQDDDGAWHEEQYSINSLAGKPDAKIKFTSLSNRYNEETEVDDVRVTAWGAASGQPAPAPAAPAPPPLDEGFEGGLGAWAHATSAGSRWAAEVPSPQVPGSGASNKAIVSDNCDYLCIIYLKPSVDISGLSSPKLHLDRYVASAVDYNEYLKVEASSNGGTSWSEIALWDGNDASTGSWVSHKLDVSSYATSDFAVRLTARSTFYNEVIMVDNVAVSGASTSPTAPTDATDPAEPEAVSYAVYVASEDSEVHRYEPDGTFVDIFVTERSGGLDEPWGLAFGPDGHLYVADNDENAILRYDPSGTPVGKGSQEASDATWADTLSRPYGLSWSGDTLYVAEYHGIERFTKSGESLGYWGQAKNPSGSPYTSNLFVPYDVEAGSDGYVYATPSYPKRVFAYHSSTGNYAHTIDDSQLPSNTRGLAWDTAGTATASDDTLIVSGSSSDKAVEISPSSKSVTASHYNRAYLDDPYGAAVGPDGVIYVTNEDDDNVAKINGTEISRLFAKRAMGMEEPRDVAIGPASSSSGSSGAAGASAPAAPQAPRNQDPDFDVVDAGGMPISYMEVPHGSSASYAILAEDEDGDEVTLRLEGAPGFVSISLEGGPALSVDASRAAPGAFVFDIIASDGTDEEDSPYVVVVAEAPAGAGGASGASGPPAGDDDEVELGEVELRDAAGAPADRMEVQAGQSGTYYVSAEGARGFFLSGAPAFVWLEAGGGSYSLAVDASEAGPGEYEFDVVAYHNASHDGTPYVLVVEGSDGS